MLLACLAQPGAETPLHLPSPQSSLWCCGPSLAQGQSQPLCLASGRPSSRPPGSVALPRPLGRTQDRTHRAGGSLLAFPARGRAKPPGCLRGHRSGRSLSPDHLRARRTGSLDLSQPGGKTHLKTKLGAPQRALRGAPCGGIWLQPAPCAGCWLQPSPPPGSARHRQHRGSVQGVDSPAPPHSRP